MKYHGQCWCGDVTFECEGDPLFTQYCHCGKCRQIMSESSRESDKKGYAFTAAYHANKFNLTSDGALDEVIRNNAKLFLCSNCRSQIYGISIHPELQAGIGINANNFDFGAHIPAAFKPVRHIWYANHIVTMHDNLPKFKDAPKDQFGSGELY